jgi:hypothetical protein
MPYSRRRKVLSFGHVEDPDLDTHAADKFEHPYFLKHGKQNYTRGSIRVLVLISTKN